MDVTLQGIEVMCVRAEGGPQGAREAFKRLEARLPSLRGRKFYGTYHAGEYRACVALQPGDDPSIYGFETYVIPGGVFVREKMKNWSSQTSEIGEVFEAMATRERHRVDSSRPSIEFYRSQNELILLLPVLPGGGT